LGFGKGELKLLVKKLDEDFLKKKDYLVVVIGSGPAGISLALELEKQKIKCLIIEAGSKEYSESSQSFYKGKVEGIFPKDLSLLRLRQFGGTTGHWGGLCRPLDEYDYKIWPINKKDLDGYLDKACEILEINRTNFSDRPITENIKLIKFEQSPVNFFDKYYEKIVKSDFIDLSLDTVCLNFEINQSQVTSIICKNQSNKNIKIKSNFFVLASGAIENCRILKWSNIVNNKNFLNKIPIGNYFMEHPYKKVGFAIGFTKDINNFFSDKGRFSEANNSNFTFAPTGAFIAQKKILNAGFFVRTHNSKYKVEQELLCKDPGFGNNLVKFINSKKDLCGADIVSSWEQDPIYDNKIILDNERDFFDIPRVKIIYKKSQVMKDTIKLVLEDLGKYFIINNIGRIGIEEYLYNNEEYLSDSGFHHLGGTRMGSYEKNSVVDKNLKVHNSKNLFICGSSVFPSGGHANPTLTIIQLSLRLSDFLKDNLKNI